MTINVRHIKRLLYFSNNFKERRGQKEKEAVCEGRQVPAKLQMGEITEQKLI